MSVSFALPPRLVKNVNAADARRQWFDYFLNPDPVATIVNRCATRGKIDDPPASDYGLGATRICYEMNNKPLKPNLREEVKESEFGPQATDGTARRESKTQDEASPKGATPNQNETGSVTYECVLTVDVVPAQHTTYSPRRGWVPGCVTLRLTHTTLTDQPHTTL